DDLLAVWGDHIDRARPRGIDPLATDEQLVVYAHGRTLAVIVCAVVTRELHALLPAERLVAHALPRHAVDHPEGQVVVPADQLAQRRIVLGALEHLRRQRREEVLLLTDERSAVVGEDPHAPLIGGRVRPGLVPQAARTPGPSALPCRRVRSPDHARSDASRARCGSRRSLA